MDRLNLTIILVSYYSYSHIERIIKYLKNFNFLIIENSKDQKVKNLCKNKKNVKVIFPNKNLGYGAGNNLGILKSKTNFNLILNPDTFISKENIYKLIKFAKLIKKFGILLPRLDSAQSLKIFDNNNNKNYRKSSYKFIGLGYASGCAMLINKSKFKKKIFDENIFLYKEETDLIKRCNDNKINSYILKNVTVKHYGTKSLSTNKISNIESIVFRNWHWTWSNFYFYKKHFGFFYALCKFSRSIFSSLIKKIIYYFINKKKYYIYNARFNGYLNSILNKKSSYRMIER